MVRKTKSKVRRSKDHPTWGGKRPGAGRQPYKTNPINCKFSTATDAETFAQLQAVAKARGVSRNSIVNEALKLHLYGR